MTKFGRNYILTIQKDGEDPVVISYPLTLDVSISRATFAMSGRAVFRIHNLNQSTRGKIYRNYNDLPKMMSIKLDAGYGTNLSTIFNGNVNWCRSYREEGQTDFITEINAFDIGYVKSLSTSDWTVEGARASQSSVIQLLCADLKRPVDGVPTSIPVGKIGVFPTTTRRKFTASGFTWDLLKQATDDNCYIDNGKVYCIQPNEAFIGGVTTINNASGLLGSPKVDGVYLYADMVFEPGLMVGQKVNLESTSIDTAEGKFSGVYKILGLDHTGVISGAVSGKMKTHVVMKIGSAGGQESFTTV